MNIENKRIILSKTNQMGDLLLALPIASALKKLAPTCHIICLAREYTRPIAEHYQHIDEFADWNSISAQSEQGAVNALAALRADIIVHIYAVKAICTLAKKAKIPLRIGSGRCLYSWWTCNKLVNISRSKSGLHETQLDMMFMKAFGVKKHYSQADIIQLRCFKPFAKQAACLSLLDNKKFNLIMHPKTRGQHIEWTPQRFAELIALLPHDKFNLFVTGNAQEGQQIRAEIVTPYPHVHDLTGKLSLEELMQFIANADGMICASTGAVHIAASYGIYTLGLYAPIRPFHAGRWGPVGDKAETITINKQCDDCRYHGMCKCITEILPQQVCDVVIRWYNEKFVKAQ